MANARVLGRNIAFAEYQARNDVNLERRMQAAAIGRDLMQQAANLYASAGQGLAAAGSILSGQMGKALEAFSYARNFRDDLRVEAYESARRAQGVEAPKYTKTAPMERIPVGTEKQSNFGYDSSMKGAFDKDASSATFKTDREKIIDQTQTLLPHQTQDNVNPGPIGQ
jgi:hypothetical protein